MQKGWRWALLCQRAFFHPPPSSQARTPSFACPDMLITSLVCSPVICLFVCFSFHLLVNSSQWERRQRREKLRMGHKSHQALVQLESASTSPPPPPFPASEGFGSKAYYPEKGSISGCTRVRLIAIYTQGRLSAEEEESKNTCWLGLCTTALMHRCKDGHWHAHVQVCAHPKGKATV